MQHLNLFILLLAVFTCHYVKSDTEDDLRKLAQANLKFTLDVYKTLTAQNQLKSFVASPFSMSTLFSMLLMGAKGQTADEIKDTLGYDEENIDDYQMQSMYKHIMSSSQSSFGGDIANAIWNSKVFEVSQKYKDSLTNDFRAEEAELDFTTSEATNRINRWVREKTSGKIPSLFDEPLSASTLLVLVNAIYFKSSWKFRFPESQTQEQVFHGEDADSRVQMMHVKEVFNFKHCEGLKSEMLELEYGNSNVSMVVILPFRDSKLRDVEAQLTTDVLVQCLSALKSGPSMDVFFPKIKLEQKFDLIPIMEKLKTRKVFSTDAELSGITNSGGLYVTEALQRAFLEIDEQGTTAAAASGVSLSRIMSPSFKADRPFTFLIRNKANNLISFIGRYA